MGTYAPAPAPDAGKDPGAAAAAAPLLGPPVARGGTGPPLPAPAPSLPLSPNGGPPPFPPLTLSPAPSAALRAKSTRGGPGGPGGGAGAGAALHLLQVLPQCLAGRALAWGNSLALKPEEWVAVEEPYFAAPGEFLWGAGERVGWQVASPWPFGLSCPLCRRGGGR
jgi:hypothetical protein